MITDKKRKMFRKINTGIFKILRAITVVGICFIIIYPSIREMSMAFMTEDDIYDASVVYIPKHFTTENFERAITYMHFGECLINSLIFSTVSALLQTFSAILVGYGFARFKFKGRGLLFFFVILTLIVPPQTLSIPLYLTFKNFDFFGLLSLFGMKGIRMLDSPTPFFLLSALSVGIKSGLFIFLTRQQFRAMPKELEEAASIDGAGTFRIFSKIMLPSASAISVTVFLFSFVWQWNDTFYSSMFLLDTKVMSRALGMLKSQVGAIASFDSHGFSKMMAEVITDAGKFMYIVPLVIIYLFLQKKFIQSIERSGLVG